MPQKIIIISGSPRKQGNTAILIDWLIESLNSENNDYAVERAHAVDLEDKARGCTACRLCQQAPDYGCVIKDDVSELLNKIIHADVIIMATPLYFFSASAQLKSIMDRMFSLYKWDNTAGTMQTVLKDKHLAVMASAFEEAGLEDLVRPFAMTAEYSQMSFSFLTIPNAGISGQLQEKPYIRDRVRQFAKEILKSQNSKKPEQEGHNG